MPMADEELDWMRPTRSFLYGKDKTKKTTWACKAAEAGFNVVLIDGDDGASIIKSQISLEARRRILVVDVVNTTTQNTFARFMATFMRQDVGGFIWDEQKKATVSNTQDKAHSFVKFDVNRFTMNDVVIIDSWTALCDSLLMEWAKENQINLTEVEKEGDQFSLMGYQSRYLNFVMSKMKTFPCHFIVIGHETVYEKFEEKTGPTGRKVRIMVEQITQPFSSTGPHAKKIGASFSNYLRFRKISETAFRIDTGGDKDIAGGSRQLAPKQHKWEDISPATIFEAVGSKGDFSKPNLGAIHIKKGDMNGTPTVGGLISEIPVTTDPVQPQVLDAGSEVKPLSLSERLKLRKAT